MMTKTRQTREILIETHSITIIRTKSKPLSAHCDRCLKTVAVFAPEQVAEFLQITVAEIYRRVEAKQIHLTTEGRTVALICSDSLGNAEIENFVKQ